MTSPAPIQCAHPACKCEVPPERLEQHARFCSDWCAAETTIADGCGCGHAPCAVSPDEHGTKKGSVISVGPDGT